MGQTLLGMSGLSGDLLPYLQGSDGTAGCQIQVLGLVEIISEHGEVSCQKVVVLYSLQNKAALMKRMQGLPSLCIFFFKFIFKTLLRRSGNVLSVPLFAMA